jgi:hypothetical protein
MPNSQGSRATWMRIDRISANIRYSKAQEGGAWKTVELAAEASVTPSENWQEAQSQLYAELGQQLKALWGNGNGHHKAENGAVAAAEPKSEPGPIQRHQPPHSSTTARSMGRSSSAMRRARQSGTATGCPKVAIAGRSNPRAIKTKKGDPVGPPFCFYATLEG